MDVPISVGARPLVRVDAGDVVAVALLCRALGIAYHWDAEAAVLSVASPCAGRTVVLDPVPGDAGPDRALELALHLVDFLHAAGARVTLTRQGGSLLPSGAGTTAPSEDTALILSLVWEPGRRSVTVAYPPWPFGPARQLARAVARELALAGLAVAGPKLAVMGRRRCLALAWPLPVPAAAVFLGPVLPEETVAGPPVAGFLLRAIQGFLAATTPWAGPGWLWETYGPLPVPAARPGLSIPPVAPAVRSLDPPLVTPALPGLAHLPDPMPPAGAPPLPPAEEGPHREETVPGQDEETDLAASGDEGPTFLTPGNGEPPFPNLEVVTPEGTARRETAAVETPVGPADLIEAADAPENDGRPGTTTPDDGPAGGLPTVAETVEEAKAAVEATGAEAPPGEPTGSAAPAGPRGAGLPANLGGPGMPGELPALGPGKRRVRAAYDPFRPPGLSPAHRFYLSDRDAGAPRFLRGEALSPVRVFVRPAVPATSDVSPGPEPDALPAVPEDRPEAFR